VKSRVDLFEIIIFPSMPIFYESTTLKSD